jgi:hypothetical protein
MAAAACYFANERRKKQRRPTQEGAMQPLMQNQFTRDTGGGGSGGGAQPAPAPADLSAEYEEETGAPTNAAARKAVARDWSTVAHTGTKPRVIKLPFDTLQRATGGFDEDNQIGGGASCMVYRGQVFGLLVAIKVIRACPPLPSYSPPHIAPPPPLSAPQGLRGRVGGETVCKRNETAFLRLARQHLPPPGLLK